MATEYAVVLEDLVKRFDSLTAVNGINLKIRKGEIFGLLGPNGAGKSTTINMILGLLPPTSGRVLVDSTDMQGDPSAARNHIGIVTQETVVEPELTAEQNLMIFGRLYHIPAPELLLLDEPTTGLDVQNRTKIWNLLREINKKQNVTILLTTQYLEEADQLCDRIGIIDHGRLIALGTPTELRQKIGMSSVIEISADKDDLQKVAAAFRKVGLEPKILTNKVVAPGGGNATKKIEALLTAISAGRIQIRNISMHEPTIDDVFLKLTGSEVRDTAGEYAGGRADLMLGRGR